MRQLIGVGDPQFFIKIVRISLTPLDQSHFSQCSQCIKRYGRITFWKAFGTLCGTQ